MCPSGTYSPFRGATDISQCLPCPAGRVCGFQGMRNLTSSEACPGGHVCGSGTTLNSQYDHKCPAGYYCHEGTEPSNQLDHTCDSGFFCEKGTTVELSESNQCPAGHFCPMGTSTSDPSSTRCPRKTSARVGSNSLLNCFIETTDICDKLAFPLENPFEDNSYYPRHRYSLLDENITAYFDSSAGQNATGEIAVLKKILPLDSASSIPEWKNDTVEVFRACPAYVLDKIENLEYVAVIGRNFRNSPSLMCRYTSCITSDWSALDKNNYIVPRKCRNGDGSITQNISSVSFEEEGIFVSETRVMCPAPKSFFFQDDNFPKNDSPSLKCKRDASGSIYYLQECNANDMYTGKCGGNGFMRVYSLIVSCSKNENLSGACDDAPSAGAKLNPCLSLQMLLEISNDGRKFSGNTTVVPHVVGVDRDPGSFHDYKVPGTYAIFTRTKSEITSELSKNQEQMEALQQMTASDFASCMTPMFEEEAYRTRESGWFALPFMHRAHLSFDLANLPTDMKYDEHFKIAIFVRPSRCKESVCDKTRIRIPDAETLPCVQPMDLPTWFVDSSVSKHQRVNLTMLALDDAIFKTEIHILHGSFLASADYFLDSMVCTYVICDIENPLMP